MTRRVLAALVLVASAAPSVAQEAPRPFANWEMDQAKAQALENALGEIPAKYSLPIINFMQREEQLAQTRVEAQRERQQKLKTSPQHSLPRPVPSPDK